MQIIDNKDVDRILRCLENINSCVDIQYNVIVDFYDLHKDMLNKLNINYSNVISSTSHQIEAYSDLIYEIISNLTELQTYLTAKNANEDLMGESNEK